MGDFLDSLEPERPEPNIRGNFECFYCREKVELAYLDRANELLKFWCSQGHESTIKEFRVNI